MSPKEAHNGTPKRWWRDRFITLMVIPERTRRVHRIVIPFFLLKLGVILVSLGAVFFLLIGVDYIHVLGRMAENKRLKGENYKLRQDLQLIRNKVDLMESTIERVRNYAKKLQILTGQGDQSAPLDVGAGEPVWSGSGDSEAGAPVLSIPPSPGAPPPRVPAAKVPQRGNKPPKRSPQSRVQLEPELLPPSSIMDTGLTLDERVIRLQDVSLLTEASLSQLQIYMLAQSAVMAATPSLLPINGWVSSPFGYRRHPYDGSYRLHAGVDIAAESGTPVRATGDGLVIFAGNREGYGKAIVVDHGYGIRTLFAHSSKLFVNAGTRVKRGEKIAEVGSTGRSTGPHIHYEIRKHGVPVNPNSFLSSSRF